MSGTGMAYKQDLPPPGGYKPVNYLRVPAKTYFSGLTMFIAFNVITFTSALIWGYSDRHRRNLRTEDRSARIALQPMIFAEKDRLYLKRLRKLREEEEELMKGVPGWEVGTYWGEPIYLTRPANEWHDITPAEYWVHNAESEFNFRQNFYKYL